MLLRTFDLLLAFYFYFYLSLFLTDYGFVSNITGPTGVFAFLLSARYFLARDSFYKVHPLGIIRKIVNSSDRSIMLLFAVAICAIFSGVSLARHFALSSGSQDLGIFDQAIWNTTQGKILFSSLKGNMSLLGDHFEPILLLIVPFYLLWSSPLVILILQAALLGSAVIPLFLILRFVLKERTLIMSFIAAFALSRPLRGIAFSDFHPECFIVPLLFWAYYFIARKKYALFWLCIFLTLLCKEDAVIYAIAFGLFVLVKEKRYRLGLSLCAIGVAAWFLETRALIPLFHPKGIYPYMDRLPFGPSYGDNLNVILTEPLRIPSLFFTKEKIEYCLKMFGPLGFISLLSPVHYLLIGMPLLRNLLPQGVVFSGYYNITSHYTAGLIPFIFISAIHGTGIVLRKAKMKHAVLYVSLFILFFSLMFFGKTDGYKFRRFLSSIRKERTLKKIAYLKILPSDASVAANFNLVPHLAHRRFVFEWHPDINTSAVCEYIVIDKDMLGYILPKDLPRVERFLENASQLGYRIDFKSENGRFLILHNPNINKALVEAVF